ncbi:MAG: response regulator [Elusimicrobia bacterium]|nr:response regulator [Elusimicrobiota bacterium]MBP9699443.1 response regulator [Elusimicrobiota bacterium]
MADILVVEDDEANREFIRFVLQQAGHRVRTVCDGQKALDAVAVQAPDLIVLDVMLPEVHGYEVCHRLKQSDKTAGIKILILSAKTFSADRHQALGVGADDFLSKPADPKVLVERVRLLLNGTSPPVPPTAN